VRFTWPEPDALYRIDPGGPVKFSADHVFVALIDGTVKESVDGGRTWSDRVKPPA
jgi:hypothetical protein